jgi:hypothetical protein
MYKDRDEEQMKKAFRRAAARRFDTLARAFRARRSGFVADSDLRDSSRQPRQNLPSRRGP